MKYDENSSTFKLWLVYTFRPLKWLIAPSFLKMMKCFNAPKEAQKPLPYLSYMKEPIKEVTFVGNVVLMFLQWFFATIWNLGVFILYEIIIRILFTVVGVIIGLLFIIIRMIFVKFDIGRLRKFLKYSKGPNFAWALYNSIFSDLFNSRVAIVDSNENLETLLIKEYGESFTKHKRYKELEKYYNSITYCTETKRVSCEARADVLSAIAKELRNKKIELS